MLSKGEDSEVGEHSAQRANMLGSGSAHLLTPFEALSSVRFSFRMCRSASRVYKPFSFQCSPFESSVGAFSLLIRVGVAREQSVPPCHSVASLFIVATVVIVNKVETSRKKLRIGRAILPVN